MSPRIGLDLATIVVTAAELADERGFDEVTLALLAQRLGIRSPSLYNHVNGLQELRKMLAVHGIEQLFEALRQASVGKSGDEAVYAMGAAYVSFVRHHPGLYDATLRAPEKTDPDVQIAGNKIVDLALKLLRTYGLEDDAALHTVRGLRSIFHGFASLEQRGGFDLCLELDESFRLLIATYLAGIKTIKKNVGTLHKEDA